MLQLNNKEYRTRSGKRVFALRRVTHNSAGEPVSFPLKGTVIEREKPIKTRYQIWDDDGRASVFGDHPDDLIPVNE